MYLAEITGKLQLLQAGTKSRLSMALRDHVAAVSLQGSPRTRLKADDDGGRCGRIVGKWWDEHGSTPCFPKSPEPRAHAGEIKMKITHCVRAGGSVQAEMVITKVEIFN